MGVTHLSGLEVAGVPTLGTNLNPIYTGNFYFVNETTGSDGNTGSADSPFATLSAAHSAATANQNDVVVFEGTIHLTSTLTWSKSQVHLIGSNAPTKRGKRSRISSSGSTAFSPMVSVTASGCNFRNFGTFYGFDSASNNAICWQDTGGRNSYDLVEFLGFGNGTASTGTANITGARALKINTSTGENTFRSCVFGVDTITRDATNYTVEIAGGAPRITFQDCDFEALLGSSGASACHLLVGSAGIDRYVNFVACRFMNAVKSTATAMTGVLNVSASAGGFIMLDYCTLYGATDWEATPSNSVVVNMPAPSASAGGLAINNT